MARRLIACVIFIFMLMLSCPAILAQEGNVPPMPPGAPQPSDEPGLDEMALPPPPPEIPAPEPSRPPKREAPPSTMQLPKPPVPAVPKPEEAPPPTEEIAPVPVGPGKSWSMFKCDAAHTGYTEEQLNFPLKLIWKHITEVAPNNPSSPAVADGVVYFCSGRRLYAVNAETGSLRWQYPPEESLIAVVKSSPLVGDDLIYFGGGDGRLYAVTKENGTLAWSFATKGIMNSSPVLVDGVIYVGSSDDNLYALDARTGQQKWPGGFRTRDDVSSSPAVVDGLVYFLSNDMVLYAAHTSTGRTKWQVRIGAWSRSSTPVVAENTVYLAAGNVLQAYQAKSGRLKWGTKFASDITTVPAVANGGVYFACRNGKLYALTSAGRLKWKAPADIGAYAYSSPVIAGNTVIIGANRGILVAADAETGALKWKYVVQPSSLDYGKLRYVNVAAAPAVSNGTLYVLADDGALHAFRYDMPDSTPPQVPTVRPPRDFLMSGDPPIEIAAVIADPESGVNTDTISLRLDGEPVEYKLVPEYGIISYRTPVTQPVTPLPNGRHAVSLSVSDWAGNKTEMEWYFTVDNQILKRPKTQPGTQPGGPRPGPPGMAGTSAAE